MLEVASVLFSACFLCSSLEFYVELNLFNMYWPVGWMDAEFTWLIAHIAASQFCITFPLYYSVLCYYYIVAKWNYAVFFFYASAVWPFIFVLRGTIAGPPPPSLRCPACSFSAQGFCSELTLLMPRGWDECLRSNRCVTNIQTQLRLNGLFSFEKFLLLNPCSVP